MKTINEFKFKGVLAGIGACCVGKRGLHGRCFDLGGLHAVAARDQQSNRQQAIHTSVLRVWQAATKRLRAEELLRQAIRIFDIEEFQAGRVATLVICSTDVERRGYAVDDVPIDDVYRL